MKQRNRFHLIIPANEFTIDLIEEIKCFYKYAYILHDKDFNSEPHYHVYIEDLFHSSDEELSAFLNIDNAYIFCCSCNSSYYLKYFIHDSPEIPYFDKLFKYDKSDIIKNF